MNCRIVRSKLSEYVDQELSGREMLAIREHTATCSSCAHELNRELKLKTMLGSLKGAEPSIGFESRLIEAVLSQSSPAKVQSRLPWRHAFFAAAAGAAIIFGVLRVLDRGTPSVAQNSQPSFDLVTDQTVQGSMDPFGGAPVITVSNAGR